MKKFLTVLLVIAVMFTFSFGSAFAAVPTTEQKTTIATEAAKYTAQFDQAATAYKNTLTFKEGKLVGKSGTIADSILSEAIVDEYIALAKEDAKTAFSTAVAGLYDDDETWTDTLIITKVGTAYTDAVKAKLVDTYVFSAANLKDMTSKQLKADKEAALAELAAFNDTSAYSNNVADWSFTVGTDTVEHYVDMAAVTGKATGTVLTAKGLVDAIVATQTNIVTSKEAGEKDANIVAIGAIATAVKTVKDIVNGHKITATEDYFIEAVPTLADLNADTTLDAVKKKAIAQMEAVLTAKTIAIEDTIDAEIAKYSKYAKLSTGDQEKYDALKKAKSDLAENVAAVKEVYTARINNAESKTDVTALVASSTAGALIVKLNSFANDGGTKLPDATTQAIFDNAVKVIGYVADLKADAALYAQQKDVNGQPYYDAATLQDNLEEGVKALYSKDAVDEGDYTAARAALLKGFEATLINAKIDYIKFINGTAGTLEPKDSKGVKVTSAWNTTDATATADNTPITAMKLGAASATGFSADIAGTDALYANAQKAELEALVDATEAAIKDAKDVAEIEKIFAEAHDKYTAIPTVNDHHDAWEGKLGAAYTKGEYEKELNAYVTAFTIKNKMTDYPAALQTVEGIMDTVVYPVVFEATTEAELAAKVAEAKAAVDSMLTTKQVAEQNKAVVALINAIPAKVTLEDKAAIVAAADALADYEDVPGSTTVLNEPVLTSAIGAYEDLLADQLDAAAKALNKTITTADKAAVEELRALYDAYAAFCEDYVGAAGGATTDNDAVKAIEAKLLKAQVAEVEAMMIKLPANPTVAQKAEVEAARAAFNALPLAQQAALVGQLPYQNLLDAEEALDLSGDDAVKALLADVTVKASSAKVSKGIKVTVKADVSALEAAGYTVEYKFYRSTKKASGYVYKMTSKTGKYTNTAGKKGVKYYYKAKLVVKNAAGEVVAESPLKQCTYACRTWTK